MALTTKNIGIALLAGCATALLCLGVTSGSGLSVILYFLSAVPLMVATLGWGATVGVIGAVIATAIIGLVGNFPTAIFIVATTIFPAVMAGFLMNLARPADELGGPQGKMVWFALADVVFRLALTTAAAFIAAGILIGYGPEIIGSLVEEFVSRLRETNPEFSFSDEGLASLNSFMLGAIPFLQPAMWVMVLVGNLYVALAITRTSGQLKRPRDEWPLALRMPRIALVVFGAALVVSFFSGPVGLIATAVCGALSGGFMMAGFAFFHAAIRGKPWRPVALFVVYFAVLLTLIAAVPFFLLGLIATARPMPVSDNKTPPSSNSNSNT